MLDINNQVNINLLFVSKPKNTVNFNAVSLMVGIDSHNLKMPYHFNFPCYKPLQEVWLNAFYIVK